MFSQIYGTGRLIYFKFITYPTMDLSTLLDGIRDSEILPLNHCPKISLARI